ncbi:hypothetical protein QYF36_023410 [Acer negundo]|nr:hypothetical protein QYF36_023410 [Acer negundo]
MHLGIPNYEGVLKEYSHIDHRFACLQGPYDVGPVRGHYYDSSEGKKTLEWEDDKLLTSELNESQFKHNRGFHAACEFACVLLSAIQSLTQ